MAEVKQTPDTVLNCFSQFDLNEDGCIDRVELSSVLKALNSSLWTDDRVERLFAEVDKNNDGKIELEEFLLWIFDAPMLQCRCGYTCGTHKALDRHILRFAKENPEAHGLPSNIRRLDSQPPATGTLILDNLAPSDSDPSSPAAVRSRSSQASAGESMLSPPAQKPCITPAPSPVANRSLDGPPIRILVIRHAQSANKAKERHEAADLNPGLTDLGLEQAEALSKRLKRELRPALVRDGCVLVVCSPMRRCLLTIQPTVQALGLPAEDCICHGGAYEFGCAGTAFAGTTPEEISEEFPEFRPAGFGATGAWDYRGSNEREDSEDTKARVARLAAWIRDEAAEVLRGRSSSVRQPNTLLFVTHQTVQDLLCQVLVDGTDKRWVYGEVLHKLQNAGITEVKLLPEGTAVFGNKNDGSHLLDLRFKHSKRPSQ